MALNSTALMSEYTLHGYFRSSCTARLRMALLLKNIPFTYIPVNLLKSEQLSEDYKVLNPSASVPLLIHSTASREISIGQSVAALEYLDETHPSSPLLPVEPEKKALVRALVNIIACDTQPVTNLRIMRRVRALGGSAEEWNKELLIDGLTAYEKVATGCSGKYSIGDKVTMADVCLIPAVWNAKRFGVDPGLFPTIRRVMSELESLEIVKGAGYFRQLDTPEELRVE